MYDAPHVPRPWGAKVSAYLWTKSIAAGALLATRSLQLGDRVVGTIDRLLGITEARGGIFDQRNENLGEHRDTGEPVDVRLEEREGRLVALRIDDA